VIHTCTHARSDENEQRESIALPHISATVPFRVPSPLSANAADTIATQPKLSPLDGTPANCITNPALAHGKRRIACLDLDEHDAPELALVQTVEDDEVDRLADELRVLRAELEVWEIRRELLEHLTPRHRSALGDGVTPNVPRASHVDERRIHQRETGADHGAKQ